MRDRLPLGLGEDRHEGDRDIAEHKPGEAQAVGDKLPVCSVDLFPFKDADENRQDCEPDHCADQRHPVCREIRQLAFPRYVPKCSVKDAEGKPDQGDHHEGADNKRQVHCRQVAFTDRPADHAQPVVPEHLEEPFAPAHPLVPALFEGCGLFIIEHSC